MERASRAFKNLTVSNNYMGKARKKELSKDGSIPDELIDNARLDYTAVRDPEVYKNVKDLLSELREIRRDAIEDCEKSDFKSEKTLGPDVIGGPDGTKEISSESTITARRYRIPEYKTKRTPFKHKDPVQVKTNTDSNDLRSDSFPAEKTPRSPLPEQSLPRYLSVEELDEFEKDAEDLGRELATKTRPNGGLVKQVARRNLKMADATGGLPKTPEKDGISQNLVSSTERTPRQIPTVSAEKNSPGTQPRSPRTKLLEKKPRIQGFTSRNVPDQDLASSRGESRSSHKGSGSSDGEASPEKMGGTVRFRESHFEKGRIATPATSGEKASGEEAITLGALLMGHAASTGQTGRPLPPIPTTQSFERTVSKLDLPAFLKSLEVNPEQLSSKELISSKNT